MVISSRYSTDYSMIFFTERAIRLYSPSRRNCLPSRNFVFIRLGPSEKCLQGILLNGILRATFTGGRKAMCKAQISITLRSTCAVQNSVKPEVDGYCALSSWTTISSRNATTFQQHGLYLLVVFQNAAIDTQSCESINPEARIRSQRGHEQ